MEASFLNTEIPVNKKEGLGIECIGYSESCLLPPMHDAVILRGEFLKLIKPGFQGIVIPIMVIEESIKGEENINH